MSSFLTKGRRFMKILLIAGGTKIHGSTDRAVTEAEHSLKKLSVSYEKFELRSKTIASCSGCGCCKNSGRCIYSDAAQRLADLVSGFDGYIFFSPVHYGGATGAIKSTMGRLFYSKKNELEYKPAAAIAVSRRGGNITALEEMARFFSFASMPYVSGNYPGIIHGTSWEEVEKDEEGLQTIRSVCENMVWLIKCIQAGKNSGIEHPVAEEKIKTSYIR